MSRTALHDRLSASRLRQEIIFPDTIRLLMKQNVWSVAVACAAFALMSFCVSKNAIKYNKDVAVINTSSIVKARGHMGNTPVKIFVRNNKIVKIESLPNQETPAVFAKDCFSIMMIKGVVRLRQLILNNRKRRILPWKDWV